MITPVTLIKGDKISIETDYRDALPVNMHAVERNILGAVGYMLVFPGLTLIATGQGIDRGGRYNERFGKHYRTSGTSLVRVNTDDTVDVLGAMSGTEQVAMPYSFNTQCIISDGRMFLWDEDTSTFTEVTDPDLGDPIDGVWVDGYYFLTDGEFIYHTDINDETAIDPLKFATSEFSPDPTLGVSLTQDDKVMVWNRYSLEYFVNVATENFAFQRVETRAQKIGIVATHAKCESEGNWYITGGRKEEALGVYAVSVGSSTKVSTREIDKILAQYTEPELVDMRMDSVEEDNIHFIYVHLPNETVVFNANIAKSQGLDDAWFILKTGTGDETYRGINGVFDGKRGKWVFGDKVNSNIGLFDNTVCTQYGEIAEWLLYTPLMSLDGQSVDEIEIETLPGNVVDDDATVAFSTTYDGVTYSQEWWTLYGEENDYNQRFYIRRLGDVSDWVGFRFRGASKSRMSFALMKVTHG
jgi:hypothetical protein